MKYKVDDRVLYYGSKKEFHGRVAIVKKLHGIHYNVRVTGDTCDRYVTEDKIRTHRRSLRL